MDQVHKYFPGQRLLIDLNSDECFIGEFKNVYPNEINVVEVYDVIENVFIPGMHIFYKNEIRTIRPYKIGIKQQVLFDKDDKDKYAQQVHPEVTLEHLIRFNYLIKNLTFLGEPGDVYDAALRDMSEQQFIAVSVETINNFGRNSRPEYITILTKENLYIVDLRYMAKSYRKLAPIFESTKPIKIIHNSPTVADCLKYRLGIHIRSVFDTLVAIVSTGGSTEDISLDTAVHKYLNVPSQFFTSGGMVNWYPRPLDDSRMTLTARKVLFLQRLQEVLIQKHLLRNFCKSSEDFAHGSLKNSDSHEDENAIKVCNKNETSVKKTESKKLEI